MAKSRYADATKAARRASFSQKMAIFVSSLMFRSVKPDVPVSS